MECCDDFVMWDGVVCVVVFGRVEVCGLVCGYWC